MFDDVPELSEDEEVDQNSNINLPPAELSEEEMEIEDKENLKPPDLPEPKEKVLISKFSFINFYLIYSINKFLFRRARFSYASDRSSGRAERKPNLVAKERRQGEHCAHAELHARNGQFQRQNAEKGSRKSA